ncbi:dTMP kinase [Candidatus Pacearchaeota archaeon]|nr:dTMP kinase [Candidatus Pacearchaeota archaeon]
MVSKKGVFIAFEGVDGCGKSTQIKKFCEYLYGLDKHNHVIMTREPYKDTSIREILRSDSDPLSQADKIADLYIEDRKKHVSEVIIPNLDSGNFVVSDRYRLSTIAYQAAQGLDMNSLIDRQKELPVPDITFIIDVSADVALERMKKEAERVEQKFEGSLIFQENVRNNYLKSRKLLSDELIVIIDGNKPVNDVFSDVKEAYCSFIGKTKKGKYLDINEVPFFIKKKINKYFSNLNDNIFVIRNLPFELTGASLARYSRAPTGMRLTIVNEFLDNEGEPSQEKGTELIDRVLNAYGDESVGELEGVHVGIENASMICIKTIEDRRIGGSPLEQSTRYVKYDIKDKNGKWRYLRPKEIMDTELGNKYEAINDKAFEVYSRLITKLEEYFRKQFLESDFQIEVDRNGKLVNVKKNEITDDKEKKAFKTAYSFTIRCAALDVGRCILPSSTLTQMGLLGNGRFFTNLLTTLKSSELIEERETGFLLEKTLKTAIPTFIMWNREDPKRREREKQMRNISKNLFSEIKPESEYVELVEKGEFIDELVSSSLFSYTNISLKQILNEVKKLSYLDKLELMKAYTGKRETRRDRTPRGFEAGYPITFDLIGSFAEYRDLQRHRMLTQQRQLLSTEHGFILPPEVVEVGMDKEVLEVVSLMEELNKEILEKGLLVASQYATLFNHRMRMMMGMNLREFQHLSELRTIPQGHFSYRAMVMEMTRILDKKFPFCDLSHEFVDFSDPGNKISRAKEQSRIAGMNILKNVDGSIDL